MNKVVSLNEIKTGKLQKVDFPYTKVITKKNGDEVVTPLKIWENLEFLLAKNNINLKYNEVSREIVFEGVHGDSRNSKLTDIYTLQIKEDLNMSRDETMASISRIADKHRFNPFSQMCKYYANKNYGIIREVFETIEIQQDYAHDKEFLFTLFTKFMINVVKMANNTRENQFSSQGMLIFYGSQGCYKSTWCRELIPLKNMFKDGKTLNPDHKDNVIESTKYILVELAEFDATMKSDQAKLKQFLTATSDEFRSPYERMSEVHPRLTSFIGTVNKKDFLKDETGSRRYWIIPVEKCNIDKMKEINLFEFWGAVYSLWLSGEVTDYLSPDEQKKLEEFNRDFSSESDITIALNEKLKWDTPEEDWGVYNVTELCEYLRIKEKKALKNEMMRRGIDYKLHRRKGAVSKKGYKVPMFEIIEVL